jgi:exodeoxyribonuclease VII large subunit
VISRKSGSTLADCRGRRPRELERLALALAGHDPQRTLERGYALAQTGEGRPVSSARAALQAGGLRLRFADGSVDAEVTEP